MKKLYKFAALPLSFAVVLSMTACDKGSSNENNTAPTISGAQDQTVEAGSQFNAFNGITASDAEDGDVTSKIVIEATPALTFTNGVTTPEKAGSYELTYKVTDSGGLTVEAYATLTVTRQTAEAVVYKEFDFTTPQNADNQGWIAKVSDGVDAKGELKEGSYVFEINSPGSIDQDIQLVKSGVSLKAASYRVKVWAKSTAKTYAHLLAKDESSEAMFGGTYNAVIGEEIAPIELNFDVDKDCTTELALTLGKITPNPDNPSDTTPENFKVTIDKIEFYEISGNETNNALYTQNNFADGSANVSAGDGAAASVSFNGTTDFKIDAYPSTGGGIWSIKADLALPNISIEEGVKYYYSFTVKSANAQSGECLIESATQNDAARVNFDGLSLNAGEETVISGQFTADKAVSDPVIRMQLGTASNGVSANEIVVSNVEFGKLEGDLQTVKTIYSFSPYGKGTANETNPALPWLTFNGTDEDNEKGVGTIWSENGSLFYRIDQGGSVDWHNKLVCGYNENPLVLAADSYFIVELTAKATKNVSCGFFLNPLGNWDPRINEKIELTTEEKTFTFETTDTFFTDMNFEMLFQFGSEETAALGEVTIEISDIKIYQKAVS